MKYECCQGNICQGIFKKPVAMHPENVHGWSNVIFSHCITTYRAMTNTLSYAIKRVQPLCDLKIHSSEEPTKNCTVAKCEVSWADSSVHDVGGYIGWFCARPCHFSLPGWRHWFAWQPRAPAQKTTCSEMQILYPLLSTYLRHSVLNNMRGRYEKCIVPGNKDFWIR